MQGPAATTWTLAPVVPVAPTVLPSGAGLARGAPSFLGFGIITPFRRTANDFANGGGVPLVKSCVSQVLGTKGDSPVSSGELPWRTEFGALIGLLRHKPNNFALGDMARAYGADALARWEPRVQVTTADVVQSPQARKVLGIRIGYSLIAANVPGNAVDLPADSVVVPL